MSDPNENRAAGEESLDGRIGMIFNDFLDRKARGETVSEAELLAEHPEFAEELRGYFELLVDLQPRSGHIGKLIEQRLLRSSSDPLYLAELASYRITGLLGRGGMGIVLKARDESLDRTVALKILRPELADDHEALGRFTREAKSAAALCHPNIVTIHAVGEERGTCFIAMEHVEGPTLADLIRERGALSADLTRTVFAQVVRGLSAAHEAGLIHRDIKPSNILLDHLPADSADGEDAAIHEANSLIVKIADFGLVRMVTAQTRMTVGDRSLGTPEYMSPEQARGDEDIDHRTDLYSAGVVLYEMLTSRAPFRAETPTAVVHQILHDEPRDPLHTREDVEPVLASVAMRLLAKRPEDRLNSAAEVLAAMDAGQRVTSIERRRRKILRTLAGAALLVLAGLATWLLLNTPAPAPVTDVRPGAEEHPTTVEVKRGESKEWQEFHDFGPIVEAVTAVKLVDANGDGAKDLVVVGVGPRTGESAGLYGFDFGGNEEWRLSLTPQAADGNKWPGAEQSQVWSCTTLEIGNVDGLLGEEVIVTARDRTYYPSSIAVVDPRSGMPSSTFYHTGELAFIRLIDDYYEDGRPAIVAAGGNNRLAHAEVLINGRPSPITEYSPVQVVMILDPLDMDGLGPSHTLCPELDWLGRAEPTAYAFLDLPSSDPNRATNADYDAKQVAQIRDIKLWQPVKVEPSGPIFEVFLGGMVDKSARVAIALDRTLGFCFTTQNNKAFGPKHGDWGVFWRRLIPAE